ncbi:distal membrane-arm assembly complex protein 2 [Salminus brasiliensis]|uniref:distal membrane-arm assembly complex protein 2 n=1 Tax=Salminus brasiliensis TaxID=930266 RepID=UPI003B83A5A1
MAASLLGLVRRQCSVGAYLTVASRECSTSHPTPFSFLNKILLRLNKRFHDVERLIIWMNWWKNRKIRYTNSFHDYRQMNIGVNVAAAHCILSIGGSFRFADQPEWSRPSWKEMQNFDFKNTPNSNIEEIDLSGTLINHFGLKNLVSQTRLRSLCLKGCPEVDDWFLARLYVFRETLEELDLSHCSRITEGGLAALQHLKKLRRLDITSLPRLKNPGLVRILLEEMLPHCRVTGAEYQEGLLQTDSLHPAEQAPKPSTGALRQ